MLNQIVMKNIFFTYLLSLVTICVILFSACTKEKVTGVTLNKNELILIPGETETLIANVHPADATNKNITWTSSNPEVATVTDNGIVTAISNGTADITVTTKDGRKTATCVVTVDYRAQWTGDWDFEVEVAYSSNGKDTIYYLGKINSDITSNEIKIEYMERHWMFAVIDEFGILSEFNPNPQNAAWGHFDGNDNVLIHNVVYIFGNNKIPRALMINGTKRKKGGKNE